MIRRVQVLPFPAAAVQRYLELRKQFPRLGKLDLAIAAIVLHCSGILVTRNRRDFDRIPGLALEDWSAEPAAEGPAAPDGPAD